MLRTFRLTNEPGGMGLSCTSRGLSLAGVPLLTKTEAGFAPRPAPEIASLVKAAYGLNDDPARLQSSLRVIAEALNRGDLVRASIAAVQSQTPELSWEAAARIANADLVLSKNDPEEPRDWHGRWTSEGSDGPSNAATAATDTAAHETPKPSENEMDGHGVQDDLGDTGAPQGEFEQKYDDLGPVEFAKRVIQFGDWLGRNGGNLSPDEKAHALAEYSFLQNRLSFWLSYDYTPPEAQLNLHSAALTLYQGAVNGGLVGPSDLPPSMLDVGGAAWGADNAPPNVRPATAKPNLELPHPAAEEAPAERAPVENGPPEGEAPAASVEAPIKEIKRLGGVVSNSQTKIGWGKGLQDQDGGWAPYIAQENPDARLLKKGSTGFDLVNDETGEAISAKTLDTLTASRIKRPQQLLSKVKGFVHAAEDYQPRREDDVDPGKIRSKTIQVAIPQYTSPAQWRYLNLGIRYAKERGISLVITRIAE